MKFIQQIFRTPTKTENTNAKKHFDPRLFKSEKLITSSKSQALSDDKNWHAQSYDPSYYFERIIEVKLGKTDIIPKHQGQKSHMIYEVSILTSDFQFSIKKRFSQFNSFYADIKKSIMHLNLEFPKKTILVSGTNIEVVTERYELLNDFIKHIFKQIKQRKSKQLLVVFISFLSIHRQYSNRKTKTYTQLPKDPSFENNSSQFCVSDTSISFQLRKLNDYNNHQQQIISKIEKYIQYKNAKLTNDQIKMLLIGNSTIELKGLLNLSFSINNEIKSLELLRFLLGYICTEKKSYHEKIYKQFQKLPLEAFVFDYEKVKNNFAIVEFKKIFFIILEIYCQSKLFSEMKILQRYPELIAQFELWKNLYELNEGNLCKKTSASSNNIKMQGLLNKPIVHIQKTKSFEIAPKICETRVQTLFPLASAENLDMLNVRLDEKYRKSSFRSNNSTSQLTIEEDWQNCKMKLEIYEGGDDPIFQQKMETLASSDLYTLRSNKSNKLRIQLLKTSLSMSECQQLSNCWNKLIYDERHDPFTTISRIYMKLNGKNKIFKFRQQDQKVQKSDQNMIKIVKRRLQSYNSIVKSGKQNVQQFLKLKSSDNCNGFEQIITIQNIYSSFLGSDQAEDKWDQFSSTFRKVTIQLNFEGEEDYFRSEILGSTAYMLKDALQAFVER